MGDIDRKRLMTSNKIYLVTSTRKRSMTPGKKGLMTLIQTVDDIQERWFPEFDLKMPADIGINR